MGCYSGKTWESSVNGWQQTESDFNFARDMDCKVGHERAVALIDFASECMTQVGASLETVRKALAAGRATRSSKCPEQQAALQNVVTSDGMEPVLVALDSLAQVTDAKVVRRELLIEARRTLHAMIGHEHACVHDAAWEVRSRTRRIGRPMAKRAFGTTLLVKGLEFDHAVVLDADEMNANNLYVALTRGVKTLTVVSKSRIITPKTNLK